MLHELVGQHGEDHVRVTVLVQSEAKGRRLAEKYPRVRTIVGSMGEHDKVERACRDADVVVNTSPDITHDEGIRAILRGLQEAEDGEGSRGGRKRSRRAYYVHTSGASLIWDEPRGSGEGRWWDDVEDVGELCGFGDECTHAVTDRIVREAAGVVNVAIVSPGFVGGLSPSIEHPTPITMPAIMTTAKAFRSGTSPFSFGFLSICLSASLLVCQSTSLPVYLSAYLPVYQSAYLPVFLSSCLPIYLAVIPEPTTLAWPRLAWLTMPGLVSPCITSPRTCLTHLLVRGT